MPPKSKTQDAPIAGFPDGLDQNSHLAQRKTLPVPSPSQDPSPRTSSKETPIANSDHLRVYTIDLSLPPAKRYTQPAAEFKEQLHEITKLFAEVVNMIGLPLFLVRLLARLFLHRIYSKEQTEEIRGIAKIANLDMYLVVAFNTLLDLFMGCTSGGIKVKDHNNTRMVHFRTLDWGMDVLRKVIVQLDFVERHEGPIVARTITYVGFVGVLTGVRQDLSVSLNFRPYHNSSSSKVANFKFYSHLLLVLLGLRPSIASILRDLIVPPQYPTKICIKASQPLTGGPLLPSLANIERSLPSITTTASYLIFCDGFTTKVLEKDRVTAEVHTSTYFLTATNHDASDERSPEASSSSRKQHAALGMADLVAESQDRKGCMVSKWQKHAKRYLKKNPCMTEEDVSVTIDTLKKWVQSYPIMNEETHYACIMDPTCGRIHWAKRFEATSSMNASQNS